MASNSTSKHLHKEDMINDGTTAKYYFQKTVCLKDWWLIKANKDFEGKRLAVAGITSGEKQAVRVFSSAPILKRYDVFTLETVDGICVIIQGLMNKARSEENGFSSDVCNHFIFGFPHSWEICARKCSEGDSALTDDTQGSWGFENLSPQATNTEGCSIGIAKNFDKARSEAETQEYSNKKDLGVKSSSKSDKKETTCNSRDEAKPAFGSNADDASERETSFGDYSIETRKNFRLSRDHFSNSTANVDENENYIGRKCRLKNLQEHYRNSPLSACNLTTERGCNTAVQSLKDPSKLNSSKKLAKQILFSREANLSEELSSYSEGSGMTFSQKKVQGKFKTNQVSSGKFKDEKIMSGSVSLGGLDAVGNPRAKLDNRPRGKSTLNSPGTEFQEITDEMASRDPDARSFEDNVDLDRGICLTGKNAKCKRNHDGVQGNVGMQYKSDGYICSAGANSAKEKGKKKISSSKKGNSPFESLTPRNSRRKLHCNSQSESLSARKSKRKLYSPVSQKEKEESAVMSPESLHLRRSRSGRWLLPSLEFWRNQRVIYDADHQIMGIKDLN